MRVSTVLLALFATSVVAQDISCIPIPAPAVDSATSAAATPVAAAQSSGTLGSPPPSADSSGNDPAADPPSATTTSASAAAAAADPTTTTGDPTITPAAVTAAAVLVPPTHAISSIWSYPQSPIPAHTATAPASVFTASLGGSFYGESSCRPTTRKYHFNIQYAAGKPSGFLRRMTTINGQFPGPLIEANQGDVLEITVHNGIDYPQAIHWHGISQNGTQYNDGVPGVSQCAIQPGQTYTYRFTLKSEWGTYWYHSHYGNTLADGVWGGLIVHSKNDPLKKSTGFLGLMGKKGDFDDERVMYIHDFYHDQSDLIAPRLHDWNLGYRGFNIPTMPDAVLINGIGQENCSIAQPGVPCTTNSPAVVKGKIGSKIRFRIINPGSLAQIRISVDNHVLKVVEVDDTPIVPLFIHEVGIDPGQRVSFILHLNQGGISSQFWIRASVSASCVFGGVPMIGKAVLKYTDWFGFSWAGNQLPTTSAWPDLADPNTTPCKDIDNLYSVVPLQPETPPSTYDSVRMDSSIGIFIDPEGNPYNGFGFNPYNSPTDSLVSFENYINDPLLRKVENGLTLNASRVASHTLTQFGAVDIIMNQHDIGIAHPFHLHGRKFFIMARGDGVMTPETLASANWTLTSPLRRDTLTVPSASYAIIRLITDTPGVWPIHCHIGWHLDGGKLGVIVVRPDAVARIKEPAAWSCLCKGLDVNVVGPARRGYMPPQGRAVDRVPFAEFSERGSASPVEVGMAGIERAPAPGITGAPDPNKRADAIGPTPYFSMDRTTFLLINNGVTVTGSAPGTAAAVAATAAALGVAADPPATTTTAVDAYATLTDRPAGEVWSGLGAVGSAATTIRATDGSNPLVAVGSATAASVTSSAV